jgi:hypothetical protein
MTGSPLQCCTRLARLSRSPRESRGSQARYRIPHQKPFPACIPLLAWKRKQLNEGEQRIISSSERLCDAESHCLVCAAGVQAADEAWGRGREIWLWAREVDCGAELWQGCIHASPLTLSPPWAWDCYFRGHLLQLLRLYDLVIMFQSILFWHVET